MDYIALGNLYLMRGDVKQAESMEVKALERFEAAKARSGMATSYLTLSIVYLMRGELDRQEVMVRKALAIYEALDVKARNG